MLERRNPQKIKAEYDEMTTKTSDFTINLQCHGLIKV